MDCCGPRPNERDENVFHPDFRNRTVTEKFYARHERQPLVRSPEVIFYEQAIQKHQDYDPRNHYPIPRYTSQWYGWCKGCKIRFLQNCTLKSIMDDPGVVAAFKKMFIMGEPKTKADLEHCICKERRANDHWKIV